ncbi:MAG: hypothetical protein K2Y03_09480 [Sphingomonas sp.]|nr:hypothetical protein [Sphingomonas sp.]
MMMAALVALGAFGAAPARAQGDLLVAPTRLVVNGTGGGEVVVSNTGDRTTTYRISLVLRRMDANGQIRAVDEAEAKPSEAIALEIMNYAPRKITLAPQQAQTVRIGVRVPPTLAPGEYRAHLLFRAVPDAAAADAAPTPAADGMSIALTPIYGVAIPVIVRVGEVPGEARLVGAQVATAGAPGIQVDLARSGNRSVYGTIDVMAPGSKAPIATVKGIAAYPEITQRSVLVPVDPAKLAAVRGPLTVRFTETDPAGKGGVSEVPVRATAAR